MSHASVNLVFGFYCAPRIFPEPLVQDESYRCLTSTYIKPDRNYPSFIEEIEHKRQGMLTALWPIVYMHEVSFCAFLSYSVT